MRQLSYLLTALAVMGLAFWAYRENYRTQAQINEMGKVQTSIAGLRQQIGLLRAEWAYLNRPERLRELVDLNFDRLQLIPLNPDHFVEPGQIAFPDPETEPLALPLDEDGMLLGVEPADDTTPRPPPRPALRR